MGRHGINEDAYQKDALGDLTPLASGPHLVTLSWQVFQMKQDFLKSEGSHSRAGLTGR